ncbi:MAG TPA: Do family serine endopeptidase [Candidatus Deferrimicrobiaceae bacterium]|nr:Do family serine endopeptidase [Candidatus Deferrimicrobiaceae bacterium]
MRPRVGYAAALLAGVFLGFLLTACSGDRGRSSSNAPDAARMQQGFVSAVERAVPAVVNIRTVTRSPRGFSGGAPEGGAGIRDYLAELLEENGGVRENSLGSGVIVGEDGLIVTNDHVIRDADEIVVRLADRTEYRAKVVGADPRTDIALLRIKPSRKLPVAVLGDSARIKVGEWAIAVGNPFGLESTVTLGVISATGRADLGADPTGDLIQTDASINPGNSGGPLLNTRGEVVGINTAMVSGGQGIGFAIPINAVLEIERELARTGTIRRGWLGVGIQPLTPELAESFGVKGERGVLVNRVIPESPAAAGGMRGGDIVIAFGGSRVAGVKEFQKRVAGVSPGSEVVLEILRGGKRMAVTVKLAELEDPAPRPAPRKYPLDAWGLHVKALPGKVAAALGVRGGVEVRHMDPAGPAGSGGIREGDILLRINRDPVGGIDSYRRLLASLPRGQVVSVLVDREGGRMYLAFRTR